MEPFLMGVRDYCLICPAERAGRNCDPLGTWGVAWPISRGNRLDTTGGQEWTHGSSPSSACLDHEYSPLRRNFAGAIQGHLALISTPADIARRQRWSSR